MLPCTPLPPHVPGGLTLLHEAANVPLEFRLPGEPETTLHEIVE